MDALASGWVSKLAKTCLGSGAELLLDQGADGRGGDRRGGVLQLGQLAQVVGRHDVGPGREQLAQLDEGRAQLLERQPQVLGGGVRLRAPLVPEDAAVERNPAAQTGHPDDEPQSVPGENLADLPVPLKLISHAFTSHRSTG